MEGLIARFQGFIAWLLLRAVYPRALAKVRAVAVLPLRETSTQEGELSSLLRRRQSRVLEVALRLVHPSRRPRCRVYETGGGTRQLAAGWIAWDLSSEAAKEAIAKAQSIEPRETGND